MSSAVSPTTPNLRAGAGFALAAYGFWGVAPVYFVWVDFAQPMEVLAHRIVWSIPLLALLVTAARQWPQVGQLQVQEIRRLAVCALLLSVNWLTFIYAVQSERIVETALGYFINPLVSILLGWVVLKERLRLWQWAAVAIAASGVVTELLVLRDLPVIALILAFSFGFYGLLRKQVNVPSAVGLGVETLLVAPLAIGYLIYSSDVTLGRATQELLWLALGGFVTVFPLVCFAAAALRLPLSLLGFFQYLAPSLSLLIALYVFNESVPAVRWVSLSLIWCALLIFSLEGLYHLRRRTV